MSGTANRLVYNEPGWLDTLAAWLLALLWLLPLLFAVWTAFRPLRATSSTPRCWC